ncbi:MAG: hypothetical protein ACHQET_08195 [Chitinophagales bacterium]
MKRRLALPVMMLMAVVACNMGCAQTGFVLPQKIQLNNKEDYAKYEKVVINAAIWLEQTDLDKDVEKRRTIDAFIIKWVSGTPAFTLNLDEPLSVLTEKNPELLALYIASYSRNILENKNSPSSFSATKAALKSIAFVYKKGIDVARNKQLEKLTKFTAESQWNDFIVTTMKIPQVWIHEKRAPDI